MQFQMVDAMCTWWPSVQCTVELNLSGQLYRTGLQEKLGRWTHQQPMPPTVQLW